MSRRMLLQKNDKEIFNLKYRHYGIENETDKTLTFTKYDSYGQANITLQQFIDADNWEIFMKCKYSTSKMFGTLFMFNYSPMIAISYSSLFNCFCEKNTMSGYANSTGRGPISDIIHHDRRVGSFNPDLGTIFYSRFTFSGTQYLYSCSYDNISWTDVEKNDTSTKIGMNYYNPNDLYFTIGNGGNNTYQFYGSIYMDECYIKLNGTEVWRGYTE